MLDKNKDINEELSELNIIFEKISNKYKNQCDEYLFSTTLEKYLLNPKTTNKMDTIENDVIFNIRYPFCFLKRKNKKDIEVQFLVKAKFIDENNEKFSFWVCSFKFFKEALQSLGYKEAKIIKKKKILFSENDEHMNKDSNGSSSESLDDKTNIDIDLYKYQVKVKKNPFNLEKTFNKSHNIFDPLINNDNLEDYLRDINLPKNINKTNFIFSKNYLTFLNKIFDENNHEYFYYYNSKSGLTLCLLQILEQKKHNEKIRYFHFNSEYIEQYKKKYIYFKLAKLFQKEEEELYKNITEKISIEIRNYDIQGILTEIINNLNNIYIIFDNIKKNSIFYKIQKIIANLEKINTENKFTILKFIEINSETMFSICYLNNFSTIFPNDNSFNEVLPPIEYAKTLYYDNEKDKNNFIENYKNQTKADILKFNDNSYEYLIFIFKLHHINSYIENNNFLDYNYESYLINYLPYLYISLCNNDFSNHPSINKIQFRGNFIKEIINNIFISLISEKLLTQEYFKELKNKSTEGIYLEKEIIYHLVTKNIGFEKINIEKIYCFNSKFEKIIEKSEIIFIQELERAPIYDFGIIITIDGETIFKGYQIGINKPRYSLSNLSKERINIDILYFISKINKFINKKITKFTFGIITTINAYLSNINNNSNINNKYSEINDFAINENNNKEDNDNDYKNYKIMKKYCNENNFEFIIFAPKEKKFYIDNENNKLNYIDFNKYLNLNMANDVTNYLFNNEDNLNIIKIPLYPNEITKMDQKYIYDSINEIKDKQLNFIGKFAMEKKEKNETAKEQKFEVSKPFNFENLINDKYLIYTKDKNKNKTIFFNKKYYIYDYKDIDVFYVFDTSLIIKRQDKDNSNINEIENKNKLIGKKKNRDKKDKKLKNL